MKELPPYHTPGLTRSGQRWTQSPQLFMTVVQAQSQLFSWGNMINWLLSTKPPFKLEIAIAIAKLMRSPDLSCNLPISMSLSQRRRLTPGAGVFKWETKISCSLRLSIQRLGIVDPTASPLPLPPNVHLLTAPHLSATPSKWGLSIPQSLL